MGNIFLAQKPESFSYDADGNLTQDGRWTYKWDAENRLIAMTNNSNVPNGAKMTLNFGYDYHGRRISKLVSNYVSGSYQVATKLSFVYDGWNLQAELNGTNNAAIRTYMWGTDLSGTLQGAGGVGGLLSISSPGSSQFFCLDGNGNVTALVDSSSSAITAQYEYAPFGETMILSGQAAANNPFQFSTKYLDKEIELQYFGLRFYDAKIGRWIATDPAGNEGGNNLYGFVENQTLQAIDLLGLEALKYTSEGRFYVNGTWRKIFGMTYLPYWPTYDSYGEESGVKSSSEASFWHLAVENSGNTGGLCNTPTFAPDENPHPASFITASVRNVSKCNVNLLCECRVHYSVASWTTSVEKGILITGNVLGSVVSDFYVMQANPNSHRDSSHAFIARGVKDIIYSDAFTLKPGETKRLYEVTPASLAVSANHPGSGFVESMKGSCKCEVR
jgi:RHS repeat-associated protein